MPREATPFGLAAGGHAHCWLPRMDDVMPGLAHLPNAHPLFVHFPIALWWTSLLFWVLGLFTGKERLFEAGRWTFSIGLVFALVAVLTGLSAAQSQPVEDVHGHVQFHKVMMLTTAGLAILTFILSFAFRGIRRTSMRVVETAVLAATVIVMTLGADRGGLLVFHHGIGTSFRTETDGHGHGSGDSHRGGEDDEWDRKPYLLPEGAGATRGAGNGDGRTGDGKANEDR